MKSATAYRNGASACGTSLPSTLVKGPFPFVPDENDKIRNGMAEKESERQRFLFFHHSYSSRYSLKHSETRVSLRRSRRVEFLSHLVCMPCLALLCAELAFPSWVYGAAAARILVYNPLFAQSHVNFMTKLAEILVGEGHDVVSQILDTALYRQSGRRILTTLSDLKQRSLRSS